MNESRISLDDEFAQDFERARLAWLRRRFEVYAGLGVAVAAVAGAMLGYRAIVGPWGPSPSPSRGAWVLGVLAAVAQMALFALGYRRVARGPVMDRRTVLRWTGRTLIGYTLIQVVAAPTLATLLEEMAAARGRELHLGIGVPVQLGLMGMHLAASLLLPMTPRESIRPVLPAFAVCTLGFVIGALSGSDSGAVVVSALVALYACIVPGVVVSLLRDRVFLRRFVNVATRERYQELRQDLVLARRIHERLFPAPVRRAGLNIDYAYEPMRQIGGDFVYVHAPDGGRVTVVLVDVTGHGIGAALAVNRLHAELRRMFGSHAGLGPGAVLAALNDYVGLTMAADSMFATAAAAEIDPASGAVRYASAGHPSAMVRRAGEVVEWLESTTFMLGVAAADEFGMSETSAMLAAGDRLVLYTDGVLEAMDGRGRVFGVEGLQAAVLAAGRGDVCRGVAEAVKRHAGGGGGGSAAQDDVLVVCMECLA